MDCKPSECLWQDLRLVSRSARIEQIIRICADTLPIRAAFRQKGCCSFGLGSQLERHQLVVDQQLCILFCTQWFMAALWS
jgi:hypothetical protein